MYMLGLKIVASRFGRKWTRFLVYTIAAICGGLAEAYYGLSDEIRQEVLSFLDNRLLEIVVEFENTYPK